MWKVREGLVSLVTANAIIKLTTGIPVVERGSMSGISDTRTGAGV
jgi:hypothetical protein